MGKEIYEIYLEDIIPNRFQPRIAFDESELLSLKHSIIEHGIIQPLVVRKLGDKYEIIAGERRYKAAAMAGLRKVPAIVENLTDDESAEVALIENIQRADLTPIEEAMSYKNILEHGHLTQEQLASKMGKSQSTIANKLRLLNLDKTVQDALLGKRISERHARSLLKLPKEKQQEMLQIIIDHKLTVRQADKEIKKMLEETDRDDGTSVKTVLPLHHVDETVDIMMREPHNHFDEIEELLIPDKPKTNFGKLEANRYERPVENIKIEGLKIEEKGNNMNAENNGNGFNLPNNPTTNNFNMNVNNQPNTFMTQPDKPAPNIDDLLKPNTQQYNAPTATSPLESNNLFVMQDNSLNNNPQAQPVDSNQMFNFGQPTGMSDQANEPIIGNFDFAPQPQPVDAIPAQPEPQIESGFNFGQPIPEAMVNQPVDQTPVIENQPSFNPEPTPVAQPYPETNHQPEPMDSTPSFNFGQPAAEPVSTTDEPTFNFNQPAAPATLFGPATPTPSGLSQDQINNLDQKNNDLQNHREAINNEMNGLEQMVDPQPVATIDPFNEPLTPNMESLVKEFREKQNPGVMPTEPISQPESIPPVMPEVPKPAPAPVTPTPIAPTPQVMPEPTPTPQPEVITTPVVDKPQAQPTLGNINVSLRNSISIIRDSISRVESLGFVVDSEEFDFEDVYQVVIKIQKNH